MNTEVKANCPVTLTEGAVNELKRIMLEQNISPEHGLRVGVKGGGCSGFSYILGFDQPKENDEIYRVGDITLLLQKSHALYLIGMQVDFVNGLNNRGFTFNNPNATETCGCGTVLMPESAS
jgi:iron-sulfur cluster assembly protein